jgi:hypothetical protein
MAVSRAMSRLMLKSAKRAFIADSLSRRDWPTCRALSCHRREFHCQARHVPTQGCARKPPGLPSCGTSKTSPAAISSGAYLASAPTPRRASTNSGQFRSVCRDSRAKQRNRQGGYYHEEAGDKLFTFTRMQLDAWCGLRRRKAGRIHHYRSGKDEHEPRPCAAPQYQILRGSVHRVSAQGHGWRWPSVPR